MMFLLAVFPLLSLSYGASEADSPACSFPNASACIDDCFPTLPLDVIYLSEGDRINISVVPVSAFPLSFFTSFKDGTAVSASNVETLCKPQYCVFDLDSPRLEITSFNTTFSAGSYTFDVFNQGPDVCRFSFNITKAVPPTLMKKANLTTILNEDSGPLVLSPTIFHGIPPGVVDWYKDGINISRGDVYRKEKVAAEDRGVYTAIIQHQTGNVSLQYEIRINSISLCQLPKDSGPCSARGHRYYYNQHSRTCELFFWGGCFGNENRFLFAHNCEEECSQCPPTCTPSYCATRRSAICTMRTNTTDGTCEGCRISNCFACFYHEGPLPPPPSSCPSSCDLGQNGPDETCVAKWGLCMKRNFYSSMRSIPLQKRDDDFHCWPYSCLQ